MKKINVLLVLILSTFSITARAQGPLGAGFMLGSPTSLVAKYWQDSNVAFQGGLAFSSNDYFLIFCDYIVHHPEWLSDRSRIDAKLRPYLGVGGLLAVSNTIRDRNDRYYGTRSGSVGLGLRVPVGIEWNLSRAPIGVFVEIAPGISIVPATEILVQAGLGARYYF